jgi:putative methyltransferase (TIGR04325 family)
VLNGRGARAIGMDRLRPWARVRTLRGAAERIPGIRALRVAEYERHFAGDLLGAFRGVYGSFEEAHRSAPPGRPSGYDVTGIAELELLRSRVDRVFAYDYPVLFWLRPLLRPDIAIFDLGGHVGVHYHAYGRLLDLPPGLRWTVCELPDVVDAGRALAAERGAQELSFTTDATAADGSDVLIAAGVLQYIESPSLAELLGGLRARPSHLLLNKLPLTDGEPFITLQHGGIHYPAVRVCNRAAFVESIRALGYDLVDAWEDHLHRVGIPFHPERTVPHFSGLYLRRSDADSAQPQEHARVANP